MSDDAETTSFHGAKIALLSGDQLLVLLRDDLPDIPFPNCWDFPGGGAEAGETPLECVLRETSEEVGLVIDQGAICWARAFTTEAGAPCSWFFVAKVPAEELAAAKLGDEGQECRLMPVAEFLAHDRAVPYLQTRLALFLGR